MPTVQEEGTYRFLNSDSNVRSRLHYQADRNRDFDLSALDYARKKMAVDKPDVLDIGSADGCLTHDRFGDDSLWGNVWGVERDNELVAECNERFGERMQFICGNIETMAETDMRPDGIMDRGGVDVVFVALVMHHVSRENQQRVLEYLWSFVKPGGCLIIRANDDSLYLNYPDGEDLQRLQAISASMPLGPERFYARKLYPELLKLTGSADAIKINYFMGDSSHIDREERELFFNYAYQFRIPVIERAVKAFPGEKKYVELLNEAQSIYDRWKKFFCEDRKYYLLAPECIGIAFNPPE
ncbi:MAG: class I SAM-dependent methyltransferase [bacterium]|nr:class I SAM-dependent methyltransferase [bacterium]